MMAVRGVCLAVLGFFSWGVLLSQPSVGSLFGTAEDEFGDPMVGATVRLRPLSGGTSTGMDGSFRFEGLADGSYTLEVSYVSYKTLLMEVVVSGRTVLSQRLRLLPDSRVMEAVEVKGERLRDNLASLLHAKRKAMSLVDGVSSEQMAMSGDSHLGQASQRIAGVTVEGGCYLYVRGLGDRYTATFLNGASVPGLDPERNALQLDIFLSSLLDNVVVYKSFSPDLPGGFAGGLMNIETKSTVTALEMKMGVSYSYAPNVNLNRNFLTYTGSDTDWLGFDNNFRSAPLRRLDKIPLSGGLDGRQNALRATQLFSSQEMSPFTTTSFLNQKYFFSVGNKHLLFGRPLTWMAGGNYANNYQNYTEGTSAVYANPSTTSEILTKSLFLEDNGSARAATYNLLANASYEPLDGHKIKLLVMGNQKGVSSSRVQEGEKPEDDPELGYFTNTLGYTERGLRTVQLSGSHGLPARLDLSWTSSYTISSMGQPDLRFFTFGKKAFLLQCRILHRADSHPVFQEYVGGCARQPGTSHETPGGGGRRFLLEGGRVLQQEPAGFFRAAVSL